MYVNNWRPRISFSYEMNVICVILSYYNDTSVKIQHPSWNPVLNGFPLYNDIKQSIKNYLYLDLKGRPAVRDFLHSGPPGDHSGDYDIDKITELVELIASSAESKYHKFINNY